jgi:hypothetical protein
LIALLLIIINVVAAHRAQAQCDPSWLPGAPIPGVDGTVYAATLWDPDGSGPQEPVLVIGGNFTIAGAVGAASVARWDGTSWQPLGAGIQVGVYGPVVYALCVYQGQLFAGGSFAVGGGSGIARWTGSDWQSLGTGVGTPIPEDPGTVYALSVYDDYLIVAGDFDFANDIVYGRVVRWRDGQWSGMQGGSLGPVSALTIYNSELIAAVQYYSPNRAQPMAWNGTSWRSIGGDGTDSPGAISSLTVWNNQLVIGGQFEAIAGVAAHNVALLIDQGWQALGPGLDVPGIRACAHWECTPMI